MDAEWLNMMENYHQGEKVAITACSDGMSVSFSERISELNKALEKMGITPVYSEYLYGVRSAALRARELIGFYKNPEIRDIFDVSGGDISNELLPYLSYEHIRSSGKTFWGYSDLTTICNAIYVKTGKASVLYQVQNLIRSEGDNQQRDFFSSYILGENNLFAVPVKMVQQSHMEGVIVGGNIRCFLKLAGTEFFPELSGKLLLLESRSAMRSQLIAYLSQLSQMGAFEKINGLILGEFSAFEKSAAERGGETIAELVASYVRVDLPIAKTSRIGHSAESLAVYIGKKACISNDVITYPAPSHSGRDMTEEEKNAYNRMVETAEQLSIFDLGL